jgi:hypothetical protein
MLAEHASHVLAPDPRNHMTAPSGVVGPPAHPRPAVDEQAVTSSLSLLGQVLLYSVAALDLLLWVASPGDPPFLLLVGAGVVVYVATCRVTVSDGAVTVGSILWRRRASLGEGTTIERLASPIRRRTGVRIRTKTGRPIQIHAGKWRHGPAVIAAIVRLAVRNGATVDANVAANQSVATDPDSVRARMT